MGTGFAPTWLRHVSPLLHKTTLTTGGTGGGAFPPVPKFPPMGRETDERDWTFFSTQYNIYEDRKL